MDRVARPSLPAALRRAVGLLITLVDPRPYVHLLRLVHFWNYSHVTPRRKARIGPGVALAPTASFRHGERIEIGAGSHIGEYASLWAGDRARIVIGEDSIVAPYAFVTAANYGLEPGTAIVRQPRVERDVVIGSGAWVGAGAIVLAGVRIGDGVVVAAGSVVTRDLPPNAICAGVPARPVKMRDGSPLPSGGPLAVPASA
jgi:acetyltransferase-like isoleucine patch superfamily enzyme